MTRSPVLVRDAIPQDAATLILIWSSLAHRPERGSAVADAAAATARIAADPDQRLLVAVIDDEIVAAVHLIRATLTPVHADQAVHMSHLNVLDGHRRRGAGHALVEAAVTWAEEKDSQHVIGAASVTSRDANRFMARLGLTQVATLRAASVTALRARLPVEPPAAARVGAKSHRRVGQVLAKRRSQRRAPTAAE